MQATLIKAADSVSNSPTEQVCPVESMVELIVSTSGSNTASTAQRTMITGTARRQFIAAATVASSPLRCTSKVLTQAGHTGTPTDVRVWEVEKINDECNAMNNVDEIYYRFL